MFTPLVNESAAARPFSRPTNIVEGKKERLKDVNVSKIVDMVEYCFRCVITKRRVLSEVARKMCATVLPAS